MRKILVPISSSTSCHAAVRHVVREFMNDPAMEIHLLNVQTPLSRDASRFVSRVVRRQFHHEEAERALAPVRVMLDRFSIPYAVHEAVGDRSRVIAEAARRLHCDLILMGTARKNTLTRLIENSVTSNVIELSPVPVEVIAGESMSKWERYGIPAALAAVLALVLAIED